MNPINKQSIWGVWGYGIGGAAVVDFLCTHCVQIIVYDAKPLREADVARLCQQGVQVVTDLNEFLTRCDTIVPSSGVDLRTYASYSHKWFAEFDLFSLFAKKPIVAVTGSLGKTTVTHSIGTALQRAGKRVLVGGNIGVGLCSLLAHQDEADYIVLEVSSFQLEYCTQFRPTIAVWTNLYPNHLDRHGTLEAYIAAKTRLFAQQKIGDVAIIAANLYEQLKKTVDHGQTWITVSEQGYAQNCVYVQAVVDALGMTLAVTDDMIGGSLEHRLEFVRQLNGIDFYNDSKSTVPQATLAALDRLQGKNVIVLLGGLSKGVSRESFVAQLAGRVKMAICVGAEATQLAAWCAHYAVPCIVAAQFADAVKIAYNKGVAGDVVLLSPSGSSFDLFTNYEHRGTVFKQLVLAL